jgi:radical SAM superfamily enzyme YgiQ (UPF0313 family)
MKILLTCTTIEEDHRIENDHDSHYPLGLGYLHSYVETLNKGYEVETRFLNNVPLKKCLETLKNDLLRFKPAVLGISMMTHSRVGAYKLIKMAQKINPNIKIVLGGMHVSIMYQQLATAYPGVVCVIGEGEITFGELLEKWENDLPIDEVRGICYHDGEKISFGGGSRPLIEDLDILPFPKHELFIWEGKTIAGLLTSRGCPYKCNFCVLDAASRRKVRCRSASSIADEVESILANHPSVHTVWIHDDAFMIIPERTIEFCEEIIRRGIKTNFICSARFRPISKKVVMLMKEAGFVHVLFGLESGAESVMKLMKKGLTQKAVRHGRKLFSETGIKTTTFLIVGLPGETKETVDETIDFVQELQEIQYIYYDDIGVAGVYPGTELFTLAKEAKMIVPGYGVIDDNYWLTDGAVPWYEVDHKYEQLLKWKEKIRNEIGLQRLTASPEIFLKQRKLIPAIVDYSLKWNFGLVPAIQSVFSSADAGNLAFNIFRTSFTDESPKEGKKRFYLEVEKLLIKSMLSNMTEKQAIDFRKKYEKQIKADEQTIARWHTIQKNQNSGLEKGDKKYAAAVIKEDGTMISEIKSDFDDNRKRIKKERQYVQRFPIIRMDSRNNTNVSYIDEK